MTEGLWGVIIGGVIASVTAFLTTWIASGIENRKWLREKRIEQLRLRILELTPLLVNGGVILDNYLNSDPELADPRSAALMEMMTLMSKESLKLFDEVLRVARETDGIPDAYHDWAKNLLLEIREARTEIEKLLK